MRSNEQFDTDGCGIMIDGDDDVRLHDRGGYHDLANPDAHPCEVAEVHFMSGAECNFAGALTPGRHERYVDDITGQPLSPELCKKARATELDYFRDKDVWTLRKIDEVRGAQANRQSLFVGLRSTRVMTSIPRSGVG